VLTLLTGVFGKYIAIGAVILLLIGGAFGYLKLKEHEAAREALIQFNQQQIELVQKQNEAYKAQLDALQSIQADLIKKNNELNADIDKQNESINDFFKFSTDKTLDPIFNQMLNKLNGK
jgi:predicted nucleotide-binding protein (sugar kinase/HSP70/actin superfamily)